MPTAVKTKRTFSMSVSITTTIKATPQRVWDLLTNAAGFPRWNSTVVSIQGNIALGETIELKAKIDPTRVFKLKVVEFNAPSVLVWKDGAAPMFQGVRRYTITPQADGTLEFTMAETFSGLMLPMIAGSLPDFAPSFEQYAADLKQEAERPS